MNSIRRTLLVWLFAGLTSGIAVAALLMYRQAHQEANRIFDYQMMQLAASLPSVNFDPVSPRRYEDPGMEKQIVIQIWDATGTRIYHSHEQPELPQRAELGFADVAIDESTWRIYSVLQGDNVVQVAQPARIRSELATEMALRTATPLFLLFPFLGALAWLAVGMGLAPVRRIAADVQQRHVDALTPVADADLPDEIRPLTHAFNDLLYRLDRSIEAQRAFIANAAHELRTPLTALKLRIQLAERAGDQAERAAAFAELKAGYERSMRMVQQLLTLARQEHGGAARGSGEVDLAAIGRDAVAEFARAAADKGIEIGFDGAGAAPVRGDADSLRVLLNNLVDNAIRYTPAGGHVDVAVAAADGETVLTVRDDGPSIPAAERERVFDRFYRVAGTGVEGSGLGLAIARQVADAHGARIALHDGTPGLAVSVRFPAPGAAGESAARRA